MKQINVEVYDADILQTFSFMCPFVTKSSCKVQGDFLHALMQDLFDVYSANLENGREGGLLAKCSCEDIFGCWTGGTNECTKRVMTQKLATVRHTLVIWVRVRFSIA